MTIANNEDRRARVLRAVWERLFPWAVPEYRASDLGDIVRHYEEPHRWYHTLTHVCECLHRLDSSDTTLVNRDVVEVALVYHDVFYEPRAVNNEKRSAVHCKNGTRLLGRPELGEPAGVAILATKHNAPAPTNEAKLVCDIDLTILGQPSPVFDRYEDLIREEYSWVPHEAFWAARRQILQGFLARPRIYQTEPFLDAYESSARRNLERSIKTIRVEVDR